MADNLSESLAQNKAQLQLVEASLINDPGNESLQQLEKDLEKIISLTQELLDQSVPKSEATKPPSSTTSVDNLAAFSKSFPVLANGSSDSRNTKSHFKTSSDYHKKRAQKKAQWRKEREEERESVKTNWQNFKAKAFKKSSKGQVKKSIFATSDHMNGKVGVGTCGIGGKPMTEYHVQEKQSKICKHSSDKY